ncbi:MAG: hypothetical protein GXP31_04405 [Kiritimatiellaeota bacterium]|nr:hypothetical protein [Kiritimatiellota bacterium]
MNKPAFCFLLALGWAAVVRSAEVNLALAKSGAMPTALASAADFRFSAAKACDGNPRTGWISAKGVLPVWLRVEWRVPVEIHEVVVLPPSQSLSREAGPVGEYAIETLRDGEWRQVAVGNASQVPGGREIRHKLKEPVKTTAIRLVIESAPTGQAAVGEFQVRGPKLILPSEWLPRWQANWIWCEPSLYIPHREPLRRYLRRSFRIEDPAEIKEAWLLACAFDRLNQMWINNRAVLKHIGYSGGSLREARVERVPLDWLVAGENVLAAEVEDLSEVGSHGLLAELVLVRQDGGRTIIATDNKWLGQADRGRVSDWRKPGFDASAWVPCRVKTWPNTRWHWLWNVPRPTVASADRLKVVGFTLAPRRVEAGGRVNVNITFESAGTVSRDYAVVVRLGRPSFWRNHDFELWGAVLQPEKVGTSRWGRGRHRVSLSVPVPDYAPRRTRATLRLSTPEGAAVLATDLPGLDTDRYGLHFLLPVDRGTAAGPRGRDFPHCEVRTVDGDPTLHIDGKPTAAILWSSSYGNYRRYSEYAATGVKLFRPILQGSPICAPGEEDEFYPWWFEQVDRMLSAAVDVDPEIRLLPAVWMDPNPGWLFARPSEQMLGGRGHPVIPLSLSVPDRGQVRPTFMSQAWRRAGADALKRLVRHMRGRSYAPNVIGVCLLAGRAGENYWGGNERNIFKDEQGRYEAKPRGQWDIGDFSMAARRTFREFLMAKYGTDDALRRAWLQKDIRFDDILEPARFDREKVCNTLAWVNKPADAGSLRDPLEAGVGTLPMDYYQCFAEAMIDTFAAWGRAVKEASDGRLIAGCYYGYAIPQLYTSLPGFHGHTAVARACRTPFLDFYVSPSEYNAARRAGGPYWGHNIIDSLRLHNKLWIYEQDSRTFLAEHMPKTFSRRETIAVFKRDAAAALTRGVGWWWYEFAEGQGGARAREWFLDPAILDFAARIKRVADFALTLPDRGPSAEIAVFYHGESLTAQDLFPPTLQINAAIGRLTLVNGMQRVGAPYDLYNLADIPRLAETGRLAQYKMCLFLNPFYLTAKQREWLELCKGEGRTLVWLWAPGISQAGRHPSPDNVSAVTGIPGVRWLQRRAVQAYRLSDTEHPITSGLPAGQLLTAAPFPSGATWERFGNEVWPVVYVDTQIAGDDTRVLGHWVIDGKVRRDMGALCVRTLEGGGRGKWNSVYATVPYLTPELMRNIARFAGVHIYWDANDILFAGRHFVAIHTGKEPALGNLRLPRKTGVCDVFAAKILQRNADTVRIDIPPYSTKLYYLGDPDKFEAGVGLRPE